MTLPRVGLALGTLGLGVGSTWWFYSGIGAGEAGRYAYAGPLLLVAAIPALFSIGVCRAFLRGENPLAPALRLAQPGGLSRLRARTSPGLFVASMVSATIGSFIFGLATFGMLWSGRAFSDLRETYYGMCFAAIPLWLGLLLCRALLRAGKRTPHIESTGDTPPREIASIDTSGRGRRSASLLRAGAWLVVGICLSRVLTPSSGNAGGDGGWGSVAYWSLLLGPIAAGACAAAWVMWTGKTRP